MAGGEALDMALGLLRAPSRRMQLAARPLPSGMTTLLEVAGGSHAAANAAAAATGATPEELLEASRFFAQQVLFTEDATAYRVLGAMPDAPQATLVTHHRLLQRWLHPDRSNGEAWDSAYSTRVNEAWSRVRTPHARQAYDDVLIAIGLHTPPTSPNAGSPDSPPVDPVRRPHATDAGNPKSTASAGSHDSPGFRSIIGPAAVVAVAVACIALLWLLQQRDQRTQAELLHPRPDVTAASVATTSRPKAAPGIRQNQPTFEALSAVVLPAAPESAPADPATAERATPGPALDLDLAPNIAPDTALDSALDTAAPVAHTNPQLAEPSGIPATGPAAWPTALSDDPHYPTASRLEAFGIKPDPARGAPVLEILPVPELPPATSPDPLHLLRQAEDTVAQAALYLASDGSHVPPIWNDFSTEVAAAEARAGLALRVDGTMPGRINLDRPKWSMGNEHAVLEAGYRTGSQHAPEHGDLRIEMTRREQRWLVTRVQMEPAR